MDNRASMPSNFALAGMTGTPMTGNGVIAATIPGKWAAPPAPAMMAFSPRSCAVFAYSIIRSGVLCADTTVISHRTPNSSIISAAAFMVGRSESDPMMIPTSGVGKTEESGVELSMSWYVSESIRCNLSLHVALSSPMMVTWPILRCGATPSLPYQWTLAPGVAYALPMSVCAARIPASPWPFPSILSIIEHPTLRSVSPMGQPRIARKCASYWDIPHASIV
mmetsp:Transcript_7102/g.14165  ORF Transcript_7102/g.14165 Transcript_7102/m.14165 type:complete len:222 (-) Transcript_7102:953-1618(-)